LAQFGRDVLFVRRLPQVGGQFFFDVGQIEQGEFHHDTVW
jgi:hypothetical protein